MKEDVLKNFKKFTGRSATLLKKETLAQIFFLRIL